MVNIEKIKQLRAQTDISISECKKALEEAGGSLKKAKELLRKRGKEIAEEKVKKESCQGRLASYIHSTQKIGVLLDLRCQTDFVAKTAHFQRLSHELCLQIAAMKPKDLDDLLSQPWIKDESKSIKDLIDEYIVKLGENIVIKRFTRYEI